MENSGGRIQLVALHHPPPGYPKTLALNEDIRVKPSFRALNLPTGNQLRTRFEDVDPQELERRLRGYYEAYYSELQARMTQYPAMSEIFPDVLLGARHSVVELAVDGVVATHWPAQQSGFEFRLSPQLLVKDITGAYS